jgi:glycosyltransferase involved in cell wall biosynthesis
MISAVIPCYNAAAYIGETIRSVLAQTQVPDEILVVDDGSTDGSFDVASQFGHPVRVIRQPNAGECAARNRGLDEVRGGWVAFLDADDVWEPTKIERQAEAVRGRDDVICAHTGYYLFGPEVKGGRQVAAVPPQVQTGEYEAETLLIHPLIQPSTSMVRRDAAPRFPVGVRQGGDMLFFTELALAGRGRFLYVPGELTGYRMHPAQVTREGGAWVAHFRYRFHWVDQAEARLGAARCDGLRRLLRKQVLEWLSLARWNRQWARYGALRAYAATLEWGARPPRELSERLYPPFVYRIKDLLDCSPLGWLRPAPPKRDALLPH